MTLGIKRMNDESKRFCLCFEINSRQDSDEGPLKTNANHRIMFSTLNVSNRALRTIRIGVTPTLTPERASIAQENES